MKTYKSADLITELQTRTEIVLQKAISEWQMAANEKLTFTPSPEKWSAVQCLMHLNSYGNYYLPAIERAISESNSENAISFISSWLGNYFYNTMLPEQKGKKMKKMKSPKDHLPKLNTDVSEVVAEFIDQQERLLILLDKAKTINISKAKVPISIAKFIKLQLGDVFLFLIAHIERHVLQADRMIEISNKEQGVSNKKIIAAV
jgi:uncharacterized protein (DUF2164 family)